MTTNKNHKCKGCKRKLPLSAYGIRPSYNKNGGHKRRSRCRECERDYAKQFRKQHPDKIRERKKRWAIRYPDKAYRGWKRRSWRRLGLDPDEVERYIAAHNNLCEICGTKTDIRSLAVDHCHTTGKLRGLLCSNCNCGLGMFQDSPQLLMKAETYLQTKTFCALRPNPIS
jgi:hypothetical protein